MRGEIARLAYVECVGALSEPDDDVGKQIPCLALDLGRTGVGLNERDLESAVSFERVGGDRSGTSNRPMIRPAIGFTTAG